MSTEPAIGLAVRHHRNAAGLTLAQLARRAGTDEGHLSRVENGLVEPRTSTLKRIADALAIPPASFLKESAMAPPASGFLPIPAVAVELEITELGAQRLLARGALRGARMGSHGPYRVAAADLASYFRENCPDLAPPLIAQGWIDPDADRARILASQFREAIAAAAADQIPPKDTAPSADPSTPIPIKLTRAILDAMWRKIPPAIEKQRPAPRLFPNLSVAYVVNGLRDTAQGILGIKSPTPAIARLYASPQVYQATIGDTVMAFLAKSLTITQMHLFGKPEQKTWTPFTFALAHADIAPPEVMAAALALAF